MHTPHDDTRDNKPETIMGRGTHSSSWDGTTENRAEANLRTFRIQKLRARLEFSRIEGAALMERLESPSLTVLEKRAVFRRWHEVARDGEVLDFMLHLMRRYEREFREIQTSGSLCEQ